MHQGEQGREPPCVWCQVLPLMFPLTKPELAVSTISQTAQWPIALAIILPSFLGKCFLLRRNSIGNGTARKSAFLLPIMCMPHKKKVWLKSSPAFKNKMDMAQFTELGLNPNIFWMWSNLWALDLGSFYFRNTAFWSASLGPLKSLQIKSEVWILPLPYWAALISEAWVYQKKATLLPSTERYCHQGDMKQGNFIEALFWNILFQAVFRLLSCQYAFSRSSLIRLILC